MLFRSEGVIIMDTNSYFIYRCPMLGKFAKPEETDEKFILQQRALDHFTKNPDSMLKDVYEYIFREFPQNLQGKGHMP